MIIGTVSAFIATIGFSIFFHVPQRELIFCGSIGGLGWLAYLFALHFNATPIIATFIGALIVSQGSITFAKLRKMPVTIFLISGIIPLVPGAGAYQTMYAILTGDYLEALDYASYTFQSGGVIAGAIVLTTMLPRIFKSKSFFPAKSRLK